MKVVVIADSLNSTSWHRVSNYYTIEHNYKNSPEKVSANFAVPLNGLTVTYNLVVAVLLNNAHIRNTSMLYSVITPCTNKAK